jgi:UDP-glucose 4-epimerase
MNKVLITGGSGFIGKEIVKILLEKGFTVHVLDLFPVDMPGVTFFQGSVLNQEAISRAMLGCDYVIHMAAILGVSKASYAPVECLDVNILGTRNVLSSCVIHHVKKILFPSSSEVYGEPTQIPVTEETPLQPKSEYGVSKSVSEEYLKSYKIQHGLDYTIVRYFNVYGEEQRHSWVMSKFVNNALLGKPVQVFGDGSQVRAFCHVKEAASATVTALLSPEANGHVLNIGNSAEPISMKELATRVLLAVGRQDAPELVTMENSDRTKEREIFKRIPSILKAQRILGYNPTIGIDQGIQMMINHKKQRIADIREEVAKAECHEQLMRQGKV